MGSMKVEVKNPIGWLASLNSN